MARNKLINSNGAPYLSNINNSGQSIIEVLIATLVVGLVLTAIASGLTLSLKTTSDTQLRELAGNFAQEGIETIRRERTVLGWTAFTDSLSQGTFCLNELPENSEAFANLPEGECSQGTSIAGHTLTRWVEVVQSNQDTVEIEVHVQWESGDTSNTVSYSQVFRNSNP